MSEWCALQQVKYVRIVMYCIALYCIVVGSRMHCSRRLIVQSLVFSRSYLHRQPETLVVKGGTTWARNGRWILPENARLPRNIQGSFTYRKSTTWDKWLYFPSEGRRAEDFFALKDPTASAGFEPANLGTKGQHATSRPPKPLFDRFSKSRLQIFLFRLSWKMVKFLLKRDSRAFLLCIWLFICVAAYQAVQNTSNRWSIIKEL